jgi:hypothetical protein
MKRAPSGKTTIPGARGVFSIYPLWNCKKPRRGRTLVLFVRCRINCCSLSSRIFLSRCPSSRRCENEKTSPARVSSAIIPPPSSRISFFSRISRTIDRALGSPLLVSRLALPRGWPLLLLPRRFHQRVSGRTHGDGKQRLKCVRCRESAECEHASTE